MPSRRILSKHSTEKQKKGRPSGRPSWSCCLRDPHAVRARALRALLDVERHALATGQRVEVQRRVHAGAVEEVLLPVLSGNEAEPTIRHDLLDRPLGHQKTPLLEQSARTHGSVREEKLQRPHANTSSCGRLVDCTRALDVPNL